MSHSLVIYRQTKTHEPMFGCRPVPPFIYIWIYHWFDNTKHPIFSDNTMIHQIFAGLRQTWGLIYNNIIYINNTSNFWWPTPNLRIDIIYDPWLLRMRSPWGGQRAAKQLCCSEGTTARGSPPKGTKTTGGIQGDSDLIRICEWLRPNVLQECVTFPPAE